MGASQKRPMGSVKKKVVLLGKKLKFDLGEVSGITFGAVLTSDLLVNSYAQMSNFQCNFTPVWFGNFERLCRPLSYV